MFYNYFFLITEANDIEVIDQTAVFSASDNVQSGDVACMTVSIVADDVLEPMVVFLVRTVVTPRVLRPADSPDFTRLFVVDTTSQGTVSMA